MKAIKHVIFIWLLAITIDASAQLIWVQKADFFSNRYEAFGFSIGNYGYIGSGHNGVSDQIDFRQWDQLNNVWTQKANFPSTGRSKSVGFSIGTNGYVSAGGSSPVLSDTWEYSSVSNTWTQKANIPVSRSNHSAFVIGNYAYVGLGQQSNTGYLNDFYRFDPVANTWTSIAAFPGAARCGASTFAINGKGYVANGFSSNDGVIIIFYKDLWEYNPATNSWTQKADFGGGKRCASVGLAVNNIGFVGAGYDSTYIGVGDIWSYNPLSNAWQLRNCFDKNDRFYAVSWAIGNRGYISTGYQSSASSPIKDLWEFTPPNDTLPTVITNQASSVGINSAVCGGEVYFDGGYPVTARGVCWNTLPSPTTSNTYTSNGTGIGSFFSNLTGLSASTAYYVRAYATNIMGTVYGNEVTFTTTNVGIDENNPSNIKVSIVNNQVLVFGAKSTENIKTIRMIEPSGKLISQWKYESNASYDVTNVKSGIYFIQLELDTALIVVKVLK